MKIFYIGYFSDLTNRHKFCSPAANNVCSYIKDVLENNKDNDVFIINLAQNKQHFKFSKSAWLKKKNINLIDSPCYGSGRVLSRLSLCLQSKWIKNFLRNNCGENDSIIIYHSLNTLKLETAIGNMKNGILQVEEIYTDILEKKKNLAFKEFKSINSFKKHIFVSKTMKDDPRIKKTKYIILYGSYKCDPKSFSNRSDNSIVYAGTIDRGMGVDFACDLMAILPNFNLTIYGHGPDYRFSELKEKYSGFKNIEILKAISEKALFNEFRKFRFALSPRNPNVGFKSTSFPSKILNYLKNGLVVVSSKFASVTDSPFKDFLVLSDYNIEEFKKAIESYNGQNPDIGNFFKKMDSSFKNDLFQLIKS